MPILSFGEWRPDLADYRGQTTQTILNVVPQGDGYGPFKSFNEATDALPAPCRGCFFARKADGTIAIFAGTTAKLYMLDNTDSSWDDVSKSGDYSQLASNAQWQFVQFNNLVVAVQGNDSPQVYDLTSSSAFDDLGGSPPNAAYVSVVNRFLVLSGLASPNVTRVQWSDLNDITNWSSGQADSQDLPDGGTVRGVAGGEFGVIFQDAAIRRMTFSPGSPYVFGIDRISADDGLLAPYSMVNAGDRVFFCSPQGFKMLLPGGYPQPIGRERVDRTFFNDRDPDHPELFIGAHDPKTNRVLWAYKSVSGSVGMFDKALVYDWTVDRWAPLAISGQYITSLARPGLTLEGVDAAFGDNVDELEIATFDDISLGSRAALSAVNADGKAGFFIGDNLEAILVTPEQGDDNKRVRIRGFKPVTDASEAVGSIVYRDRVQDSTSETDESAINSVGICEQNINTRYARGRVRIPAGSAWTYAAGVEPQFVGVGSR
jgi:hypothetical protein